MRQGNQKEVTLLHRLEGPLQARNVNKLLWSPNGGFIGKVLAMHAGDYHSRRMTTPLSASLQSWRTCRTTASSSSSTLTGGNHSTAMPQR